MDEGREARNCWAGGSDGNMCSVCPASACIGAKVEAGSYPASFAGDCGESKLPCWRNRPTCRWRLALEEEKRKETGQRVRKGWIEKTGEEIKARIGCHDEGVVTCVALTP
jgi:hypothetical protein